MAYLDGCTCQDEIIRKLSSVFSQDAESLLRILFYLEEEDKLCKSESTSTTMHVAVEWKTLQSALQCDVLFKEFAELLVFDTNRQERNDVFKNVITNLYRTIMESIDEPGAVEQSSDFEIVNSSVCDLSRNSAFPTLSRAWRLLSSECRAEILHILPNLHAIDKQPPVTRVNNVAGLLLITGGVILAPVFSCLCDAYHIGRWWKGEISGRRCLKNILDSTCAIGGASVGGLAGAIVGLFVYDLGTFGGGLAGAVVLGLISEALIGRLTRLLFGIPQTEALENAYTFLGVDEKSSTEEINTRFRRLCLKYHPDKPGGTKEDFVVLQNCMAVIKAARSDSDSYNSDNNQWSSNDVTETNTNVIRAVKYAELDQ